MSEPSAQLNPAVVLLAYSEDLEQVLAAANKLKASALNSAITLLLPGGSTLAGALTEQGYTVKLGLAEPNLKNYWLDILMACAYSGGATAFIHLAANAPLAWPLRLLSQLPQDGGEQALAICPLSACHPLNSVTPAPISQPGLAVDALDQWVSEFALGDNYDLPHLPPAAALFKGQHWVDCIAQASSDRELFILAKAKGLLLACDQVYVDDSQLPPELFNTDHLNPIALNNVVEQHPMGPAQYALADVNSRAELPPLLQPVLPVQLHIAHSWGGGLGRWVEDAIGGDSQHRNLVLRPLGSWDAFGQSIALYHSAQMGVPLKQWLLGEAIAATETKHWQYQQILEEIIADYGVERILVSSLIGQSLDVLRSGLPTTVVLHDFYPFCPALVATFSGPCHSCDAKRQAQCNKENPHHKFFNNVSDQHWEALRPLYSDLLQPSNIQIAAPCQSVADRYRELIPALAGKDIHIIEHGLKPALIKNLDAVKQLNSETGDKLKIVILGSLAKIKGEEILKDSLDQLLSIADLSLLGTGESGGRYKNMAGIEVIDHYQHDQLPAQLAAINADLGVLLSIVPETFSYTLSELWAAGIPVVATNLGAFADRVKPGQNGWLIEPSADRLLEKLNELKSEPEQLTRVTQTLQQSRARSATEMMADYARLAPLADTLRRYHLGRRSFNNPYRQGAQQTEMASLYIDRQTPYRQVLREFLNYSHSKLSKSPRLTPIVRRPLAWLLRKGTAWLS
ncbi:MAG: glycosyltransferase [Cellvibrionaceae bacterium]|nr:glycosyltransferase [Cellvibrionaceae bacterium]